MMRQKRLLAPKDDAPPRKQGQQRRRVERVKGEKGGAPLPYVQFGKGALTWAAEAGDVEEVERRLTSKDQRALIDAQVTGWPGRTPLMVAARAGQVEVVRRLVEAGADTTQVVDVNGWSALAYACYHGHEEVVRVLVEAGSDLAHKDRHGSTVLMLAVEGAAEVGVLRYLLCCPTIREQVDEQDGQGRTALHWACWKAKVEAVQELLKGNLADPSLQDHKGRQPQDVAVSRGFHACADAIKRWAGQLGPDECEAEEEEEAQDRGGASEEALLLAEEEEEMLMMDDEDDDEEEEERRVVQRPVKDLSRLPRHKVGYREVARGRGKGRG